MNGKQESEHNPKLEKVPDCVVWELVIGQTTGGGHIGDTKNRSKYMGVISHVSIK